MEIIESLYNAILPIHIGTVFITLAIVFASDIYGALWIFGKKEILNRSILKRLHIVVWAGIIISTLSGFLLFLPYSSYLLGLTAFKLKILFVVFIILNSFVIGVHKEIAANSAFASLSWNKRVQLLVTGGVSIAGWVGAFIAAQFVGL